MSTEFSKANSRIRQLAAALVQLEEFALEDLSRNVVKAGLVKAFEFTFELCWKSMKAMAEERGLAPVTPRDALRAGFGMGLLDDEQVWLRMQKDRNTTAHTYDADYASDLIRRITDDYAQAMRRLLTRLSADAGAAD